MVKIIHQSPCWMKILIFSLLKSGFVSNFKHSLSWSHSEFCVKFIISKWITYSLCNFHLGTSIFHIYFSILISRNQNSHWFAILSLYKLNSLRLVLFLFYPWKTFKTFVIYFLSYLIFIFPSYHGGLQEIFSNFYFLHDKLSFFFAIFFTPLSLGVLAYFISKHPSKRWQTSYFISKHLSTWQTLQSIFQMTFQRWVDFPNTLPNTFIKVGIL